MAMQSQGISIYRMATYGYLGSGLKSISVTSSVITCLDAATWTDFSTARFVTVSNATNVLYKIKALTTNTLTIYGQFETTGATDAVVNTVFPQSVAYVTQIGVPSGSNAAIDITSFESTAREKLLGLRNEGQMTLSVNYDATSTAVQSMIDNRAAAAADRFAVRFTDVTPADNVYPTWCAFYAYPLAISITGNVDDKVTADITLEIDGGIRWTGKDGA